MINIQWTKFERKSIATFISEELPWESANCYFIWKECLGKIGRTINIIFPFFFLFFCRVCSNDQEMLSHIPCGCSKIAQTLCKNRNDRMLRPLYHIILEKYELSESENSTFGISKVTQFYVWRMIKRKYCGIFHSIWKDSQEEVPTNLKSVFWTKWIRNDT